MILASQNVQIAEEKDFVREKISVIFFVRFQRIWRLWRSQNPVRLAAEV